MPPSSSHRPTTSPPLDPFDPGPAEDIPKIRAKAEKKRRKHEAASTVDQRYKEEVIADIEAEALVLSQAPADSDHNSGYRNASLSGPSTRPQLSPSQSEHPVTSPIFATLGEAFREKLPLTSNTPFENPIHSLPPAPATALPDLPQAGSSANASPHSLPARLPFNEEVRGGFSSQPPSASPRQAYRLPVRRTSGYQALVDAHATSPRGRPVSMPSQFYGIPTPSALNPNQLRGVRDTDTGFEPSRSTSRKGLGDSFFGLDSLALAADEATSAAENILLTSSGGNLHVFKHDKDKTSHLGCVEGLRGVAVSAKVIPCTLKLDRLKYLRPLIAVIIHGPLLQSGSRSRRGSNYSSDSQFDPSHQQHVQPTATSTQYQTTVEVYSLRTRRHVSTLYASPPAEMEPLLGGRAFEAPPPIGALTLHVKGKFLVVSSGVSGEVYIYDVGRTPINPFRCIGKVWTSVPQRKSRTWSSSSASSEAENYQEKSLGRPPRPDNALLSLSSRMLAYVPPVPPSRSTIFGKVNLPHTARGPPGLTSHTAPSQPQSTCELDTPLEDSRVNRVARDVTQEMLKGARWVGDQGKQAWRNYWSKPSEPTPYEPAHQPATQQFPPTHASDDQNRISQQPVMVSVLDLEKLAEHQDSKVATALQPIATFPLPGGCSFLSFNPSGLSLLTASSKGDVQYVWDLMQMVYPRSSLFFSSNQDVGPIVRQVARYTRVTIANIVDAVWLEPRGEKLAIVTDRGTVHLHDLPQSALQWPPPTRAMRPANMQKTVSETVAARPTSSGWNSAFSAVSGGLAAVRTKPLIGFGGFNLAQASAGVGARGSKIMASGFSKSVEAATGIGNSLIHMGETRLHVSGSSNLVNPGCVRWLTGKDPAIAIAGNGVVRVYRIVLRTQTDKKGKRKSHSVVGERLAELSIPDANKYNKYQEDELPNDGINVEIAWPSLPHAPQASYGNNTSLNPLSFAEIDSCTPYQPFHIDRRVGMYAYADTRYSYGPSDKWVFGKEIPTRLVQDKKGLDSDMVSLAEPSVKELVVSRAVEPQPITEEWKGQQPEANLQIGPVRELELELHAPMREEQAEPAGSSDASAEQHGVSLVHKDSPEPKGKKKGKGKKKSVKGGKVAHAEPSPPILESGAEEAAINRDMHFPLEGVPAETMCEPYDESHERPWRNWDWDEQLPEVTAAPEGDEEDDPW
ncbi:MAG: hypothetical protein LQ340_001010 [Diploschistes diacapsis]|nr:MAG: hypothetical protein LQ340_001010 [Diploschistes diacapsis]